MNWKTWLKGLAAAAVGGATTATAQVVATTGGVNKGTGVVAAGGAIATVVAYLLRSPLGAAPVNQQANEAAKQA